MSHEQSIDFVPHEDAQGGFDPQCSSRSLVEVNPSMNSTASSMNASSGCDPQCSTRSLMEVNPSMNSTASSMNASSTDSPVSEMEIIERMEIILDSMREMFAKYFKPKEIVNSLYDLDEKERKHILSDSSCHSERGMRLLTEQLPELDNAIQVEFYRIITHFDEDTGCLPQRILSGSGAAKQEEISCLMQLIMKIVEGRIIERLTSDDIVKIIDILGKKDLMNKSKKSIGGENPYEDFMLLLKQVRKKPDCPFELQKILQGVRPDLFPSIIADQSRSPSPQNEQKPESEPCLELTGESKSTAESHKRLYEQLHVKPKDMEGEGIKMLIDAGALHPRQITTEEKTPVIKVKSWNSYKASLSDDEYDDDDDEEIDQTMRKVPFVDDQDVDLKLRDYQKELAQVALEGHNAIICAPTGCGKTRVALDIMFKHLKKGKGAKHKRRRVCFFSRTVPLANQQYKVICKYLPEMYKANIFTGESEYSISMHLLFENLDVIVLTPMILQNHIRDETIKDLTVFSLLIFDECHHTREGEPYQTLMSTYVDKKLKGEQDLPQVVGLTASFPVEKANTKQDAVRSILQLCANLDASTISVVENHMKELKDTVAVPTESCDFLRERTSDLSFEKIIKVMEKLEKEAKHCAKDIGNENVICLVSKMPENKKEQRYNNWTAELLRETEKLPRTSKETNMSIRLLVAIAKYLATYHSALETHDLVHLRDVIDYLDDCFAEYKDLAAMTVGETRFYDYFIGLQECMETLCHEDNPNLLKLSDAIEKNIFNEDTASRGIIFVRTRAIAEALVSWLNQCSNKKIASLKARIFTGTNAKESQGGMTQSQQNDLVEDFRKGKVNLLVATSVAEEGLDVPECNLVIKYNHVGNEITTIQTRGRSRKAGGQSILLAMEDICKREIINRKRTELMFAGIDIARKMTREEFNYQIVEIQNGSAKKREIDEMLASQTREQYRNQKFKMFCKGCRQFCIESVDIRTICGTHRVVVNRDIWNQVHAQPISSKLRKEFVARVICRCDVEDGKKCNGSLGIMIYYNHVYFLALGISHYTIEEEGQVETKIGKKWKDLPYPIEELSFKDIKKYISPKKTAHNVFVDQETEHPESYMSSFASSVRPAESQAGSESDTSYTSALSESTDEIFNRYDIRGDAASMSPDNSLHKTHRKAFVDEEKDSGFFK